MKEAAGDSRGGGSKGCRRGDKTQHRSHCDGSGNGHEHSTSRGRRGRPTACRRKSYSETCYRDGAKAFRRKDDGGSSKQPSS